MVQKASYVFCLFVSCSSTYVHEMAEENVKLRTILRNIPSVGGADWMAKLLEFFWGKLYFW